MLSVLVFKSFIIGTYIRYDNTLFVNKNWLENYLCGSYKSLFTILWHHILVLLMILCIWAFVTCSFTTVTEITIGGPHKCQYLTLLPLLYKPHLIIWHTIRTKHALHIAILQYFLQFFFINFPLAYSILPLTIVWIISISNTNNKKYTCN